MLKIMIGNVNRTSTDKQLCVPKVIFLQAAEFSG